MPRTNITAAELETLIRLLTAQELARFGIGQNDPAYQDNRNRRMREHSRGMSAYVIRVLCAGVIGSRQNPRSPKFLFAGLFHRHGIRCLARGACRP